MMTCLTYDDALDGRFISPSLGAHKFYETRSPLLHSQVILGAFDAPPEGVTLYLHRRLLTSDAIDGTLSQAVRFTFVFKHVVIQSLIRHSYNGSVQLFRPPNDAYTLQCWPSKDDLLSWPPAYVFDRTALVGLL
ncbi:MAG: hypothetical protein LC808_39280, partial [Actinobacteria bacterium]|nr:hypothetical protein [Actinomycetota bacterium]